MKTIKCENCGQHEATKSAYDIAVCEDCYADICDAQPEVETEYAEELNFEIEENTSEE